jgi:hypothetical protein
VGDSDLSKPRPCASHYRESPTPTADMAPGAARSVSRCEGTTAASRPGACGFPRSDAAPFASRLMADEPEVADEMCFLVDEARKTARMRYVR